VEFQAERTPCSWETEEDGRNGVGTGQTGLVVVDGGGGGDDDDDDDTGLCPFLLVTEGKYKALL
jgi:hypothetical protein